jgi:hypothetical protein
MMASPSRRQIEAAQEFAAATAEALRAERGGVRAGTVIAAAARMAGTFLFRSLGLQLEGVRPGQPVVSEQANQQGPRLVQVLMSTLAFEGIRLGKRLGQEPEPADRPQLDFLQTQRQLEPLYSSIKDGAGLSQQEAADAAAVAVALLIRQFADALDPDLAFGLAAHAFVEGAKTAPDPVTL